MPTHPNPQDTISKAAPTDKLVRGAANVAGWVGGLIILIIFTVAGSLLFGLAALAWTAALYAALWIGVPAGIAWAALPLRKAGQLGLGSVLGDVVVRLFAVAIAAVFIVASLKSFRIL